MTIAGAEEHIKVLGMPDDARVALQRVRTAHHKTDPGRIQNIDGIMIELSSFRTQKVIHRTTDPHVALLND
jgi:hypothetical protein